MNKFWIFVVVVIIAVVGVWWYQHGGSSGQFALPSFVPAYSSPTPSAGATSYAYKKPTPTSQYSYSQLVQIYGTNRIQFNSSCQAQPSSIVLKNGTGVMLDNRSPSAIKVTLNGKVFNLVGYGYMTTSLQSSSVPTVLSIGCNSLINVGTVKLQANISQ